MHQDRYRKPGECRTSAIQVQLTSSLCPPTRRSPFSLGICSLCSLAGPRRGLRRHRYPRFLSSRIFPSTAVGNHSPCMPEHGCREPRSKGNAGEIAWCQTVRSHVTHNAGWDVRRCASCFRPTDPPLVHVPRPAGWDGIAMCVCTHPHPSNHLSHAGVYRPAGSPAVFVANKACPEHGALDTQTGYQYFVLPPKTSS